MAIPLLVLVPVLAFKLNLYQYATLTYCLWTPRPCRTRKDSTARHHNSPSKQHFALCMWWSVDKIKVIPFCDQAEWAVREYSARFVTIST